jgi:hypothetical protein
MFPGRFGGPLDSSNYRHRVLHKLARELGLPKLTFQVIRRTITTLGKTKGHHKDIQGLMRHSRLATTSFDTLQCRSATSAFSTVVSCSGFDRYRTLTVAFAKAVISLHGTV